MALFGVTSNPFDGGPIIELVRAVLLDGATYEPFETVPPLGVVEDALELVSV